MLRFYDENRELLTSALRFTADGNLGASKQKIIYIKNDDLTKYYTNIVLSATSTNYEDVLGEWAETGFGVKFLYGERQPTETEWDQVKSGESIILPDIGDSDAADTANYYPIWIRVLIPGKTSAQRKTDIGFKVTASPQLVGV